MKAMLDIQARFRDFPIKWKVMLVTCTTCLVALFAVAGELYVFESRHFRETFEQELRTLSKIMADNCAVALAFNDPKTVTEVISPLAVKPQIRNAAVLSSDGKEFARFGQADECPPPAPNDPAGVVDRGESWTVVEPVMLDGKRIGTFFLDADFAGPRGELQRVYASVTTAVFAGSLLLVILLTMKLQRFITLPIQSLATASNAVARDRDYSVRVERQGGDEVGVLTDAFNQMLARIQEQDCALHDARGQLQIKLGALEKEVIARERVEGARVRLTATLEATPDFVGSADPTGRALSLNAAARRMIGIGENEDISQMMISEFHPKWANAIIASEGMPAAIRDGTWTGETAVLARDGREIHVSQVVIAHKSAGGALEYFSTVMRDITGQREAEEALRIAEVKFRGLVEQLPAITYHAALGETCTWTYVSPQVLPLLGFTPEEWLASDRLWFDHIHPDDRQIPLDAEAVAMRTGSFLAEYRMTTRDGELRWFRDQAVFVPGFDAETRALYGVMMDITAAKAAESRLADLNKQLVDTSRHAGMAEVATGVLHNVGNVLNSVNVSAGIVAEKLRRSKAPKVAKAAALLTEKNGSLAQYLTEDPNGQKLPGYLVKLGEHLIAENTALLREVDQLGHNIEHIKEVVAMQQSYAKVSGVFEDLPVDRLVEDAISMNYGAFERHGVTVVRKFSPAPPAHVDRHKVLQILINLIRNAKYALDEVEGPDKRITISIQSVGENVHIAVADNGIGIPEENLARIFGHGFTTRRDGHGFGLHSGANAAKEIGGTLSVHSDGHGRGATFTLALPGGRERRAPTAQSR